jgi:argininosuccinate lyase
MVIGGPLGLAWDALRAALDPWAFVRGRNLPGGPAPEAMQRSLMTLRTALRADRAWLQEEQMRLRSAGEQRERRAAELVALADDANTADLT